MKTLETCIYEYLSYCKNQKRLDEKTIRAYRCDLTQFHLMLDSDNIESVNPKAIEKIVVSLNSKYKPRTAKRKIASYKAFLHYMDIKEYIAENPFHKLAVSIRTPLNLPKIIPLSSIERILRCAYYESQNASTEYKRRNAIRDTAIIELLFATGMRISELCSLTPSSIDLNTGTVLIYGKGSKERMVQIGNDFVLKTLNLYADNFKYEIIQSGRFFANQSGRPVSDQTARRIIAHYTRISSTEQHITPHMFRHTFATSLLEEDVDIRYIQKLLGHSSIHTTEIYTHVSMAKQREILCTKHPRNKFSF